MMEGNKHMKTLTNIIHPALALFALAGFEAHVSKRKIMKGGNGVCH